MTTYYLVKDSNGKFYVRQYFLGIPWEFLGRTDETEGKRSYWWPESYAPKHAAFDTEAEAIARFDRVKAYPGAPTFTKLRKIQ